MNDTELVSTLQTVAAIFELDLDIRRHGASYCTVYLSADPVDPAPALRMRAAFEELKARGVEGAKLTRFNNPPFYNRNTGRQEAGHPRHGQPLIEIDSVWWPVQPNQEGTKP